MHIRRCFSFYERRFLECGFFSVGKQATRDIVIRFIMSAIKHACRYKSDRIELYRQRRFKNTSGKTCILVNRNYQTPL